MKEQISRESGRVLLLKIQDEGDVSLGVKILKGELACKYDTIQFCYRDDLDFYGYDLFAFYKSYAAKKAIGDKGDVAVKDMLSSAIQGSQLGIHVRFIYCNLSEASVSNLAAALLANQTLIGFTCFGNEHGYHKDVSLLKQAVIDTSAPLRIWNNRLLPDDITQARQRKQSAAPPMVKEPAESFSSKKTGSTAPPEILPPPPALASEKVSSKDSNALPLSVAQSAFKEAIKFGGAAPWSRSKLMMVGEGRAGKSSTVRSFLNKDFDPNLASTVGADTTSTVSVDRQDVVNWIEKKNDGEFSEMAARAAARMIRKKDDETTFSMFVQEEKKIETALFGSEAASAPPQRRSSFALKMVTSFRRGSVSDKPKVNAMATTQGSFRARPETALQTAKRPPQPLLEEKDVAKQFDFELISDALSQEDDPKKKKLALSIWDYGGQEVFYALHHVFLTEYGVYCVVFDMSCLVGSTATETTQSQCVSLLQFWIRSIRMHAEKSPMFLVGTHKDKVPSHEDHLKINSVLEKRLKVATNSQVFPNIVKGGSKLWFFPVDNSQGSKDSVIRSLREKILESVKDKDYVKMSVPIAWMRVLDLLLERRKTNPYLTLTQVAEVAEAVGVATKIRDMLCFFHELGVLCYFDSSSDVRQLVVLDPQWLVDAFTKVIRDFNLHRIDAMEDLSLRTTFASDLDQLQTRGIVSKHLLYHFWSAEPDHCKDFLVALMRNMSLLCDWIESGVGEEARYLVPSLLELDGDLSTMPGNAPPFHPLVFFDLSFKKFFLPHGLFPRLVALVVTHGTGVFKDSITPWITKTKAIVSFGEADFQMENVMQDDVIRVGVIDPRNVNLIRTLLVSMMDKLRDEIMGDALKMDVHFVVSTDDTPPVLIAVAVDNIEKARKESKKRVLAIDGVTRVNLGKFDVFYSKENEGEGTDQLTSSSNEMTLPASFKYHLFISYCQETAMDQVGSLYKSLEIKQFRVWFDQMADQITEAEMVKGVEASRCLLVFLSKGVLTRPFCILEIRKARSMKRPILFIHEEDRRTKGFAEIYEIKDEAPEDLKDLFAQVESIPFRRRKFEEDAMLAELGKRLERLCQ